MVPNLDDLLSYGYLDRNRGASNALKFMPIAHDQRALLLFFRPFLFLVNKYPDLYVPFRHFPDVGEKT